MLADLVATDGVPRDIQPACCSATTSVNGCNDQKQPGTWAQLSMGATGCRTSCIGTMKGGLPQLQNKLRSAITAQDSEDEEAEVSDNQLSFEEATDKDASDPETEEGPAS